jgi:hypothetical protein
MTRSYVLVDNDDVENHGTQQRVAQANLTRATRPISVGTTRLGRGHICSKLYNSVTLHLMSTLCTIVTMYDLKFCPASYR